MQFGIPVIIAKKITQRNLVPLHRPQSVLELHRKAAHLLLTPTLMQMDNALLFAQGVGSFVHLIVLLKIVHFTDFVISQTSIIILFYDGSKQDFQLSPKNNSGDF